MNYSIPQALNGVIENIIDLDRPGIARGFVLNVYKAKLLELVGCMPKRPKLQTHEVPFRFAIPEFENGYRLAAAGAKIPLTPKNKRRRAHLLGDLQRATLLPQDHEKPGYDNPVLVITFAPGSMWTTEINMRRYQLLQLLNERLGREFLKKVKVR